MIITRNTTLNHSNLKQIIGIGVFADNKKTAEAIKSFLNQYVVSNY